MKAPDRGSFPLDHFHECDKEAEKYSKCVQTHELMPKRCRKFQIEYLQCRMNSGLMEKEEVDKLGFLQENSWENEAAEKRVLFQRIQDMKKEGLEAAMRKKEEESKQRASKETKLPE